MSHPNPTTEPCLVDVQLAFTHWRKSRTVRGSTPQRLRELALQLLASHSRAEVCKALAINSAALTLWSGGMTQRTTVVPSDFVALSVPSANQSQQADNQRCQFSITLPNGVQVNTQGEHTLAEVLNAASVAGVAP